MCGIAGFISSDPYHLTYLDAMAESISHRGPDGRQFYHYENYHVAMTRLAINDIEGGEQPLYNSSETVSLMYNGEIYNYREIRRFLEKKGYFFRTNSDGEVIAHLYDEYGEDAFSHLDGMFAIALWDCKNRCLFLARDQAGEKPLYYHVMNQTQGLCFASEIGALQKFGDLNLSLDLSSLWDLPTFLWIPEPNTVFQEIKALERGTFLKFSENRCQLKAIEKGKNFRRTNRTDYSNDSEWVRKIVESAVQSRLLSDVPLGAFLSGGLDSSIIVALTTSYVGPIDTFTIRFENFNDPIHGKQDESKEAAWFAAQLGCNHTEVTATPNIFREKLDKFFHHAGEPFAVSSGLGILAISEHANNQGNKVLLSGDCADECFGGYSWYNYLSSFETTKANPTADQIISFHNIGMSEEERAEKISRAHAQQQAWAWHYYAHEKEKASLFNVETFKGQRSSLSHFQNFYSPKKWKPIDFIRNDRNFYMPNEMLRKMDRMTMAYSVEGRVPFASPAVLALSDELTYEEMVYNKVPKFLLREAFKDLLPAQVLERKKHGFNVPIDRWLRDDWADMVDHTFSPDSKLANLNLINHNSLPNAKKLVENKERLNGHSVFSFIALNRWMELNL